ncbi:MAG TPA: toll/interleukin-1 receptor domain-containing protein, partial [Thermoanaerobaculia bacterium]|nr:toll/interleukin-1 receptor domain-containing protein [Thermoanaerobaculia bacterium]
MDVTPPLATPDLDPEAGVEAGPLEGSSKVVAMAPVKYIFSYARKDSKFVVELAQRLRQAGVDLWLDQLDIVAGQLWDHAIESALKSCGGMIAVLSPDSIASNNVMDEVSYALEEGKQLVPVLLRPCAVPFRLRRVQHVDFTAGYDAAFQRLLKALGAGMQPPVVEREQVVEPDQVIEPDQIVEPKQVVKRLRPSNPF